MRQSKDPRIERAHVVDTYVGKRVRDRRKALGISQINLAMSLGLTFQQVQKYERGSNRVSASKLFEIAECLHVPVGWFFEGCPYHAEGRSAEPVNNVHAFLSTHEALELGASFLAIPSQTLRRRVLDLMTAMASGS